MVQHKNALSRVREVTYKMHNEVKSSIMVWSCAQTLMKTPTMSRSLIQVKRYHWHLRKKRETT